MHILNNVCVCSYCSIDRFHISPHESVCVIKKILDSDVVDCVWKATNATTHITQNIINYSSTTVTTTTNLKEWFGREQSVDFEQWWYVCLCQKKKKRGKENFGRFKKQGAYTHTHCIHKNCEAQPPKWIHIHRALVY